MKGELVTPGRLLALGALFGSLLFANPVAAEEGWGVDLQVYGWLPTLETKSSGQDNEISRQDVIENLDMALMAAVRARKGKWSLVSDFIYFDLEDDDGQPVFLGTDLGKLEVEAWVITPNIGYTVYADDKQHVDLYAGARYIWLEVNLDFDFSAPLPPGSRKDSDSAKNWDAIVGVRGEYALSDKWYFPYSINGGAGQSDSTWGARAGLGYRFNTFDAFLGWRYLTWDFGNDKSPEDLTVNGPMFGAIFHW